MQQYDEHANFVNDTETYSQFWFEIHKNVTQSVEIQMRNCRKIDMATEKCNAIL